LCWRDYSVFTYTGGSWVSSNPAIATITNAGLVTGISVGTGVTFTYTNSLTGCSSDASSAVAVTTGPTVTITDTNLCIGGTTTLTPSSGGTWESSNPTIATVTNGGVVTAVSQGTVTFRFRDAFGCLSLPTSA
jgi:uncharacterized protein YjdB